MLNNKPLLFALIIILASLQFVWLPWYEMQQAAIEEASVVTAKVTKYEAVQGAAEPIKQSLIDTKEAYEKQMTLLLQGQDGQSFSLQMQQDINEKIASAGLQMEFFTWGGQADLAEAGIVRGQFSVRVTGALANIAAFGTALEQQTGLRVISMHFDWRGFAEPDKKANTTFNIEILYRLVSQ
ncbi:MAG: hypothetical protein ACK4XG_08615 [Chromatiaceae bacterium]